jgi:6-phosphofructokinase
MKKRIGILTGGGDVPPLNAVIHTAFEHGKSNNIEVVGISRGWQGLLESQIVDLNRLNLDPTLGGTVLKSSRVNLAKVENAYLKIRNNLDDLKLDGLIVIGGEDTLSNAFHLKDVPQILISKTIDNDVGVNENGKVINYFTLGYPTAAQKISSFVSMREGLRTTAYSHERIIVVESMGMHAGWLGLSSALGHPDFIIIPEFPLEYDSFKKKVIERYRAQHNIVMVVSEGARWSHGGYISADEKEKDNFGHPKFKGAADLLAKKLKEDLKEHFDTRNVNSVNPSYLYRSGKPNELDFNSAVLLGKAAINLFVEGINEPAFLVIEDGKDEFETNRIYLKELDAIEQFHRFVDRRYYEPDEYRITSEGQSYLRKIAAEIEDVPYGI